jgi:hypothetical protein
VVRGRPRRAGRMGALGRGLPVARADGGRPDAPGGSARPLWRVARGVPPRARGARTRRAVRAGGGRRPRRSADRASRRPQPVPRVVPAGDGQRAAGWRRARCRAARAADRIWRPGSRASRAPTTWARTGSRRSRCWRCPNSAECGVATHSGLTRCATPRARMARP